MIRYNPLHYDLTGFTEDLFKDRALASYRKDVQRRRRTRSGVMGGTRARKFTIQKWLPGVDVHVISVSTNADLHALGLPSFKPLYEAIDVGTQDFDLDEILDEVGQQWMKKNGVDPSNSVLLIFSPVMRENMGQAPIIRIGDQLTPFMMVHDWGEELVQRSRDADHQIDLHVPTTVEVHDHDGHSIYEAYQRFAPLLPKVRHILFPPDSLKTGAHRKKSDLFFRYAISGGSDRISDLFALWAINRKLTPDQVIYTADVLPLLEEIDDTTRRKMREWHFGGAASRILYHPLEAYSLSRIPRRVPVRKPDGSEIYGLNKAAPPNLRKPVVPLNTLLDYYNRLFEGWLQYSLGQTFFIVV